MSCEHCRCPDVCLARPEYCEWAAQDPPDPRLLRAACERSRIAAGLPPAVAPASYPSPVRQALNLAGAAARVLTAAVQGEPVLVPGDVFSERLAICRACEFNDSNPPEIHCTRCGCCTMKLSLATEACPIEKWPRWEKPDDDD